MLEVGPLAKEKRSAIQRVAEQTDLDLGDEVAELRNVFLDVAEEAFPSKRFKGDGPSFWTSIVAATQPSQGDVLHALETNTPSAGVVYFSAQESHLADVLLSTACAVKTDDGRLRLADFE